MVFLGSQDSLAAIKCQKPILVILLSRFRSWPLQINQGEPGALYKAALINTKAIFVQLAQMRI